MARSAAPPSTVTASTWARTNRPARTRTDVAGERGDRAWLLASADKGPDAVQSAVAEFCDPDVDYYPVRKFSDGQPCHGSEEFAQFLARWLEAWSRLEWAVEDLIEVGDDRAPACARLRSEGRGSGVKLEGDLYQCLWLRHRRLFRVEDHLTLSGALNALGLTGETLEAAGLRE